MFYTVILGLLLRIPSNQLGKRRRGKNSIHYPVWSLLLYLHVVRPQEREATY
jgi:ribonuclease HI